MDRTARKTGVLSSVALMVLSLTACHSLSAAQTTANTDLEIVGLSQIDANGAEAPASAAAATPVRPAGDGKATCQPVSIALLSPLTGPDSALGGNVKDGVQLAVDQHNKANARCQVTLKSYDTEGDPEKATAVVPRIIDDASAIGVIGPGNSGEANATGSVFDQAGLVAITPSATNATLSQHGWKTFFRGLANDGVQGPSMANYLKNTLGNKKVCVVDDSTDYGLGLAQAVRQTLGPIAAQACKIEIKRGDKDFSAAITQIKDTAPDSIFYGGYYAEAAVLIQQLRNSGITATFAAGDATNDPEFAKQAGDAAKDALLSCPCAPASGAFADSYAAAFGQQPGTYSAESYDLATIMLLGIDSGHTTRPALLDFVRHYQGQGVARNYQWNVNGELTNTLIWMYKVR
jgi:branched-chain amino acid transport system substrate-binding protein